MSELPLNYRSSYTWTGHASNGAAIIENHPDLLIGNPHDAGRYSPEHLLLVAAESCLANTLFAIASMSKLNVLGYSSEAEGELIKEPKLGYRFVRISIRPTLKVGAGDEARAERILEKAHQFCLIARSLNCPVEIEPRIVV